MRKATVSALGLAGVLIGGSWAPAATVTHINDDFSSYWRNTANGTSGGTFSSGYSNEAVRAAWNNSSIFYGSDANFDASATPAYVTINSRVAYRNLATPVSAADDWSVSFKVHSTSYSRVQRVVLANYDSNTSTFSGYAAMWETQTANDNSSEGLAHIRLYTAGSVLSDGNINATGTGLGSTRSGHVGADGDDPAGGNDVTDLPMSTWVLSWSAANKTLKLTVDGVEKVSVVQATSVAPTFNRLMLVGNGTGYFDNVVLTSTAIPEPTTATSVMGAAMAGGLLRRRRSR